MPGRELRSALPGAGTDRRQLETGVLTGPGNHPIGHEIGPDDSETDFSHRISVFYHSARIFRPAALRAVRPEVSGRTGVLPNGNRPLKISKIFRTIQLPGIPDFPQRSGFTPETRNAGGRRIALRRDAGSVQAALPCRRFLPAREPPSRNSGRERDESRRPSEFSDRYTMRIRRRSAGAGRRDKKTDGNICSFREMWYLCTRNTEKRCVSSAG